MDKKAWIGVSVVLVIAIVAGVLVLGQPADNVSNNTASNTTPTDVSNAVQTNTVDMKDYTFSPAVIQVKVGTTVTWTNKDSVGHNIHGDSESPDIPDSPVLAQGQSYSFTFKKAGTYKLHCHIHPYMKQTVIVTE